MKRRLYIYGWILLAALLVIAPVAPAALAQDAAASDAYPTVAALEAAVLPPRDRVDLAERLRGVQEHPTDADDRCYPTGGRARSLHRL